MSTGTQTRRGIGLATLAALLFGATVPFLKAASAEAGTWVSASLLYLGAMLGAGVALRLRRRPIASELLRPRLLLRLLSVAVLGAVCAPALLIAGARHTDAATMSLLLTLEMPFTLLLARLFFHEHLGRRALVAATLLLAGSLVLAGRFHATGGSLGGVALVIAAAAAWALDNTVSRTLADRDPLAVVALKGLLGAAISAGLAAWASESLPGVRVAAALLAIGALGYGLSLQLYLRAQTLVGAARTASVFASAPFAGTIVALLAGSPWPGWHFPIAAALLIGGVALHVSERHRHRHTHVPTLHDHLHTHDEPHHTHAHDPPPAGPHSHAHQHDALTHEHEHGDDIHHRHSH
jgi:drug/metabolite transporter (DMT)-like permease